MTIAADRPPAPAAPRSSFRRRAIQVASLFALHSSWGLEMKWLCNPVLSCHSCALAWFACPVGVFIHYSGYRVFPFLAIGMILLLGVLIGRLLCGWVCPFGLLQDLLYKIPSPKLVLPRWTAWTKYAVLLVLVFLFPFLWGEQTWASFCRFCPASALQVTIPNWITGAGAGVTPSSIVKVVLLAAVLVLVVFSTRAFCRVLCPIGAMLAPLNLLSLWQVKPRHGKCMECRRCDRACPTHDQPSARLKAGQPASRSLDCVVCHECTSICPSTDAQARNEHEGAAT